jgi:hypothetical protein
MNGYHLAKESQHMTHQKTWLVVSAICLLALIGCSRSSGRQGIEGVVTLDGKPLETGSITFVPQPGTKGPTAGGTISQGRFAVSPAGGTFAGTFRVEITAARKTGRKVADPRLGEMIDETEQAIPVEYNRDSHLTAEVTEQGSNRFEFALQSR